MMVARDRQLQDQVRRLESKARKTDKPHAVRQHWYEAYAPSVEPVAANFRALHSANNEVILMPIHLQKAMDARSLSLWARDVSGGVCGFAAAIYRALLPREDLSKPDQVTPPTTAGGGTVAASPRRYNFDLVDQIGIYRTPLGAITLRHLVAPMDISIDPDEAPWFLGLMALTAASNQLFAPAMTTGGPHCAYRATERGATFGVFPRRTGISGDRITPPHFVLRSARGVRLYADPLNG